ncbi:outer membrane transport energization protein TonB [Flavobacteriaceae bacterium MAR_2010_72]|nr:outer membrane transport energization protein TonB [Flavobacteriaceae bacterium MAR_2010_72]
MKYLETKHERNSAKITTLIVTILVLLLFVVGPPYFEPPLEYGVAVNFGTTDFGSGDVQPTEPIKSQPKEVIEEPKVEETVKESAAQPKTKTEDVLTEESEESIAMKKQKQAEAKAKAEAERREQLRQEAEERKRQEEADKKKKLDALIGGVSNSEGTQTGGEGPDSQAGDKGQLDGNPYAPSYFGGSGPGKGGVGYGLNGRGRPSRQIFKQDCNEYGLVVVRIEVDKSGSVVKAEPGARGTTNTHPCLIEPARKIALSHKWPADSKAPDRQVGFVSINFDISQ